jgi:hypothetical protein
MKIRTAAVDGEHAITGISNSMSEWCARLQETGGKGGLFVRAVMAEDERKLARLETLSRSIGLPLYETHSFELPEGIPRVIGLCSTLVKAGWKLSFRLMDTNDRRLLFRDVDADVRTVVAAIGSQPRGQQCIARVSPYKEPTISGTVLVASGDALLEMVYGPHYWLTKVPPEGVAILSCWYRFPHLSVQHSTDDLQERVVLYRSLRNVVRIALGVSLRQLPEVRSSLYAEYHWRRDLGYRFLECSYSSAWTGGPR